MIALVKLTGKKWFKIYVADSTKCFKKTEAGGPQIP